MIYEKNFLDHLNYILNNPNIIILPFKTKSSLRNKFLNILNILQIK